MTDEVERSNSDFRRLIMVMQNSVDAKEYTDLLRLERADELAEMSAEEQIEFLVKEAYIDGAIKAKMNWI